MGSTVFPSSSSAPTAAEIAAAVAAPSAATIASAVAAPSAREMNDEEYAQYLIDFPKEPTE